MSRLKLGMAYPCPRGLIRDFAAKVDKLVVVEELDAIIENHCRSWACSVWGKERSSPGGRVLPEPGGHKLGSAVHSRHGPGGRHSGPAAGHVRRLSPPRTVLYPGKKQVYRAGRHRLLHPGRAWRPWTPWISTLCMGASISGLHGFNKAGGPETEGKTVAVIGDSTFMHSGMTGLVNIAYNESNSTVIILDNSITGMTGHQQNPTTGFNIKGDPARKDRPGEPVPRHGLSTGCGWWTPMILANATRR